VPIAWRRPHRLSRKNQMTDVRCQMLGDIGDLTFDVFARDWSCVLILMSDI
jgi:hypothetical protein